MKAKLIGAPFSAKILHPQANLDPEIIYREYFELLALDSPSERILYYQEK